MKIKRLVAAALLTAAALVVFVIEAQVPALTAVPGVKLGLANSVTVFALYALGPADALAILVVRIILGSVATGQLSAALFSLSGGLLSLAVSMPLRRVFPAERMWVVSVFGAVTHNFGQIIAAVAVTRTPGLMWYMLPLTASGILTGAFTGLCAQFLYSRLMRSDSFRRLFSMQKNRK
jgi:heptaprenyl diphosphate synthase